MWNEQTLEKTHIPPFVFPLNNSFCVLWFLAVNHVGDIYHSSFPLPFLSSMFSVPRQKKEENRHTSFSFFRRYEEGESWVRTCVCLYVCVCLQEAVVSVALPFLLVLFTCLSCLCVLSPWVLAALLCFEGTKNCCWGVCSFKERREEMQRWIQSNI